MCGPSDGVAVVLVFLNYSICGTMHLRHAGSPHYCATNNGSCSAFVVGTAGG